MNFRQALAWAVGVLAISICQAGAAQDLSQPLPEEFLSGDFFASDLASPASWQQECRPLVYAFADYLMWRAERQRQPFAGQQLSVGPAPRVDQSVTARYDWDDGIRLGIGYIACPGVHVSFKYTGFSTSGAASVGSTTAGTDGVLPMRLNAWLLGAAPASQLAMGRGDFGSEQADFDYQVYDLEAGHAFEVSQVFTAGIFGGIRGARLEHSSLINLAAVEPDGAPIQSELATTQFSTDLKGLGLRAGASGDFALPWRGVHLFSTGSFSLLYSESDLLRLDSVVLTAPGTAPISAALSSSERVHSIVPIAELEVGMRIERGRFFLSGGYELANLFGVVQDLAVVDRSGASVIDRADIGLHGLFVRGGLQW